MKYLISLSSNAIAIHKIQLIKNDKTGLPKLTYRPAFLLTLILEGLGTYST